MPMVVRGTGNVNETEPGWPDLVKDAFSVPLILRRGFLKSSFGAAVA
jgi:hypothetical protein